MQPPATTPPGLPARPIVTSASAWDGAIRQLLSDAQLLAPHHLARLITSSAASLGLADAVTYLVDLRQSVLVPFVPADSQPVNEAVHLPVDSTVAGRAFQHGELMVQPAVPGGGARVWLPLADGCERLGVLAVTVQNPDELNDADGLLMERLRCFGALCAELLMVKTMYGDTIVNVRRTAPMGLAAEIQWSLLPPMTFSSDSVALAGALEPAYEVAGDSFDYAVDHERAQLAIFDGMGHGLRSSQLATVAVGAYRNSRRAARSLTENLRGVDDAVHTLFGGDAFITAVLCHLDTTNGRFSWVNAGHPAPLLLREGRLVKELWVETTLPLGLGPDLLVGDGQVVVGTEHLQPGDHVLLYTDGIPEARSPAGEFFGQERLVDLLTRHLTAELPAAETMRRTVRALLDHQQGQLTDDATMLLLEWRGMQRPG